MARVVKKKILHLVNDLSTGGTSRVVFNLSVAFHSEFEIHIVTLKPNVELVSSQEWPKTIHVNTFNFTEDPDYSMIGYLRNWFNKAAWRKKYKELIRRIQDINPDLIHCHTQPRELMIINSSETLSSIKLLYTDHSTRIKHNEYSWLNRNVLAWVYRNIYKKFHVVAVSESVAAYHRFFRIVSKQKRHWLVSNKIDTDRFSPLIKDAEDLIRVIYVARLHPKKGHETLIRAWGQVKSTKPCELLLVGGGNETDEKYFRGLAENVGSKFPIVFAGNTSSVLPYLRSSDIAVFPSLNEGLPLSLLEKMSCGLPVIASNISEFQNIIQDDTNGLFFETSNANDLALKLSLLIENPSERRRLGDGARQFILTNYGISKTSTDYHTIYKTLINVNDV